MTRYTRDERDRFDLEIKLDRERANNLLKTIGGLVLLAGAGGGLANATGADWLLTAANGAGRAMLVALVGFSAIGGVIAVAHLFTRHKLVWEAEAGEDRFPFVPTDEDALRRLPDDWTRAEYREYMSAVRDNRARFSERGAREFGGYDADKFKAILHWMIDRGWYATRNEGEYDNGNSGDWQAEWSVIIPTTPAADNG